MTRLEIYKRMKMMGIKHYIMSASMHSNTSGQRMFTATEGFHKCHHTDESFEREIAILRNRGYDLFDVIHLHE